MWFWCLTIWELKLCRKKNPEKWKKQKHQHYMLAAELTLYCESLFLSTSCYRNSPPWMLWTIKLNVISPTFGPMCLQAHPILLHHVFPSLLILSVYLNQFCRKSSALFKISRSRTLLWINFSLLQKHPLACKKYPATENPQGLLITPLVSPPHCLGRCSWYQNKLFNFQCRVWPLSVTQA